MNLAYRALESDNLRQVRDLLTKHIPAAGESDLRGFEWRYLWKQSQGDHLFTLGKSATSNMNTAAFTPDGKSLITTGFGTEMSVWDIASRKEVASAFTGHPSTVLSVAPSPDGRFIATASDEAVIVCDAKTLEPVQELYGARYFAAFSSDGMFLLTLRKVVLVCGRQAPGHRSKISTSPRFDRAIPQTESLSDTGRELPSFPIAACSRSPSRKRLEF
jgi:WD40 repeat protein